MKNIHLIIQIALGIILGMGFVGGDLMKTNGYTGEEMINFQYCWPLFAYLVALLIVGLVRLTISTGDKENGRIETAGKTGKTN
jgi:cytochrome bd-type quinol oxidase subunit 2